MLKRLNVYFALFSLIIIPIFGCSMPRIVLIDDALTPDEHIALGIAYEKKGLLDEAIREYETAAKKSKDAFLYLGNAYFLKGDSESAEKNYKKAIKKKPDHADAYNNLAWLYYLRKENLYEAEALAQKALELNPEKRDIYLDTLKKIRELK